MKPAMKSMLSWVGSLVLALLLMQLIPYGRDHTNPPVLAEPPWDSPGTRALAKQACFDCHSNETVWPWYSNVAPMSWLVYRDVTIGREHFNFSEWGVHPSLPGGEGEGEQHQHGPAVVVDSIESDEMPPSLYLLLHPSARLTPDETRLLVRGLIESLK